MRSILTLSMATLAVLSIAIAPGGMAPPSTVTYVGGGTVVVKQQFGEALADDGALVCAAASGLSVGGGCIPFGAYNSVKVTDAAQGAQVAFQVCIDNNGDGLCTEKLGAACDDDQFFSHGDQGQFFNPLGPLPQGFRTGCAGGAWQGYVVFLCEGASNSSAAPASLGPSTSPRDTPTPRPPAASPARARAPATATSASPMGCGPRRTLWPEGRLRRQ